VRAPLQKPEVSWAAAALALKTLAVASLALENPSTISLIFLIFLKPPAASIATGKHKELVAAG